MDEDVVKSVLGSEHEDAYETVKEWPIAFIQEYVKRRRFMSQEEASNSIVELAKLVKRLDSYSRDDELNIIIKDDNDANEVIDTFKDHNLHAKKRIRAKR
jgi:hypothetical protein